MIISCIPLKTMCSVALGAMDLGVIGPCPSGGMFAFEVRNRQYRVASHRAKRCADSSLFPLGLRHNHRRPCHWCVCATNRNCPPNSHILPLPPPAIRKFARCLWRLAHWSPPPSLRLRFALIFSPRQPRTQFAHAFMLIHAFPLFQEPAWPRKSLRRLK
jgi:hypothetical protein